MSLLRSWSAHAVKREGQGLLISLARRTARPQKGLVQARSGRSISPALVKRTSKLGGSYYSRELLEEGASRNSGVAGRSAAGIVVVGQFLFLVELQRDLALIR